SRTAPPRQQTLQATLDWSYELLSEPERVLLQRLSVFAGSFTLEGAEAVCAFSASVKCEVLSVEKNRMDAVGTVSPPSLSTLNTQHSTLPLAEGEVLDLLFLLVEKSLVQVARASGDGEGSREGSRYRLLETTREYALARLAEAGEVERLRQGHLD